MSENSMSRAIREGLARSRARTFTTAPSGNPMDEAIRLAHREGGTVVRLGRAPGSDGTTTTNDNEEK